MALLLYGDAPVYGPVQSRRLGRSLGVNILPAHVKVCNFNCAYCQCGWTHLQDRDCPDEAWPDPADVSDAVVRALDALPGGAYALDRLTIAGEGEPTLHPRFSEVVDRLLAVRDREAPGLPLAILSNASTLDCGPVREALSRLDERYMKLDAGDEATLKRLNGYTGSMADLVARLAALDRVTIQTMFVDDRAGRFANTSDEHVQRWIAALTLIRPIDVHVYTVDRLPAAASVLPVDRWRLEEIAGRARQAGVKARAFL